MFRIIFSISKVNIQTTALLSKTIQNEIFLNQVRFNHYTSSSLWSSVLSVSNPGAKKGRGKRRGATNIKNLNMGQRLGSGKIKVEYPGLNTDLYDKLNLKEIKLIGEDTERQSRLLELRNKMDKFRRLSIPPNERGFTGGTLDGKSIGEPLPIDDVQYMGFDTRIIEYKIVATTTSILGKKRTASCLALTGNKNGVIGLGIGKGAFSSIAMRIAKKKASQHLMTIDRFEDRTLFHNFYKEFYYTKIYAERMPSGYGLRCHRIIRLICELVGIKDIYAKVEGSTNPHNIAKCFIHGLLTQKKYEDIANEKQLHLVEFQPERQNFPIVLASPTKSKVKTESELKNEHERDFNLYLLGNKFRKPAMKKGPFYQEYDSYKKYCQLRDRNKAQLNSRLQRYSHLDEDALAKIRYPLRPKPKVESEVSETSETA